MSVNQLEKTVMNEDSKPESCWNQAIPLYNGPSSDGTDPTHDPRA